MRNIENHKVKLTHGNSVTISHPSNVKVEDLGVSIESVPLVKVRGKPNSGQYQENYGVYTFSRKDRKKTFSITQLINL